MNEDKTPKKPIAYYYGIVLIVILLLNILIVPFIENKRIENVDYGTFLQMIDAGDVNEVNLTSNAITFTTNSDPDTIFETGRVEDPNLVERLFDANVEFTQEIPTETSPFMNILLYWILPFIVFIIIGHFLFRNFQRRMGGGNAMTFGKNQAKIYAVEQSDTTFDDVAGQDEAKSALKEIVDFLHNPKKYERIGAKLPKGALLVGPPGTGKTLIAKAVAGEAKVPFFSISGSEFVEMFVGVGAARVRDLFKQAQEKAPCIVFIDEIDAIGKSRNTTGYPTNDEREQTLNQLLSEMDGFDSSKGVVILAATNRPEVLDKALLRAGRFDRRIPLELPDIRGREAILKVHARKIKAAEDVDYHKIARATAGASGADLANIVNEAALRAVRLNHDEVLQEDFEKSIETVIAGYERKNAVISQEERKIIAYHEIGHAIVAAKQAGSAPVHKISIIPRSSGALGFTMQIEEGDKYLYSQNELLNKITTLTGGRAAEEIVFDSITTGAANDIEQATKIARGMVTRFGMGSFGMMGLETVTDKYLGGNTSFTCSPDSAAIIDQEVRNIIETCYENAKEILKENIEKLHELSNYLLEKETISGEEFMEILHAK